MADALITIRNVHKSFDGKAVLRGVSLEVSAGQTLCIIGESGCGKTVLLKHVIGLIQPDAGEVIFDGHDLSSASEKQLVKLRTRFGMVFQGAALFDSLNIAENVAFPLREHARMGEREMAEVVGRKLAQVGLAGIQLKMPAELSGGMKKRVALARAIALDPEVILYDEPTTGLDPIMADVINELILRTQRTMNATSIVVTHDMTSAYKVSDRIVMLHGGEIIADGTPEDIQNTRDATVRQFIKGQAGDRIEAYSNAGSKP
jgi:phospholipid/cholesterol/gamma-HCH transport system ATP-binding protein